MKPLAPLAVALLLGACSAAPPVGTCPAGLAPQIEAHLYFGLTSVGGVPIPEADWTDFVAREVTPRFPDGLTVIDTTGQWRDRTGSHVVRQPSRVIVIDTDPGPATLAKLQAIRDAYRARFHQQSVGLTTTELCAGF
ncbi:hypothetical protein FHR90_002343 [Endobacter medicaginis]|jgi:Protein of unknown function (DUF3574)|uniref:DUF3574 domain-containing protein n=1 Tax=Endobacter medicaginis TaxID=1181271 RepID=A0A850NT50_9PROT|nr:DUF3574 domain-containing protein [Endobacter medicaginis]MBB3174502.1 hypothetical protein [Endobacter medicaginis]MCX5475049.1 DUF3574 domain-containing protein [Endobacter medicaginis]NVN32094.1 DUF3574 domain-containing protein [Endobacter medicaginis]